MIDRNFLTYQALRTLSLFLLAATVLGWASGCNRVEPPAVETPEAHPTTIAPAEASTPAAETSPPISPTPVEPTATQEPQAAQVNGEAIPLGQYEAELARYQDAVQEEPSGDPGEAVLNFLVDRLLLAQAARTQGFELGPTELQARMDQLQSEAGGGQAWESWLAANHYDVESFRRDLALEAAAAWKRDQIAAGVGNTAEQVHARQILLTNSQDAQAALAQLQAGQDFGTLAAANDPVGQGDLGWFPRGYLTFPQVEEAAFSLEPGQYSGVIESPIGFHILQVTERDPDHPLAPDARLSLQERALQIWLDEQRKESDVQILLP